MGRFGPTQYRREGERKRTLTESKNFKKRNKKKVGVGMGIVLKSVFSKEGFLYLLFSMEPKPKIIYIRS